MNYHSKSFLKSTAGVFLLMMLTVYAGCGSKQDQPGHSTGQEDAASVIVPVQIAVVERKNLSVTKTYSGTLEGAEQANLVSKLSERITGIAVRVGESVRSNQVLLNLDKSGTTSQYYQTEANFKNSEKTLQRMKSLYDEGAISLQTLDGAQTAYDVSKANFDAARNLVELNTPISGEVTAINVSLGDLAIPGAVLMTIAKIEQMKVVFNINETDVTRITLGQKVAVYSENKPDQRMEGKIVQLSKSADIRSRSFEIKALFPNTTDHWFKPGMFCKVEMQLAPRENALVVPNAAIQTDGIRNRVFVVRNGRAFMNAIQVGITDGQNLEILQGLSEGDSVATVGANNLRDSSFVNVVK